MQVYLSFYVVLVPPVMKGLIRFMFMTTLSTLLAFLKRLVAHYMVRGTWRICLTEIPVEKHLRLSDYSNQI